MSGSQPGYPGAPGLDELLWSLPASLDPSAIIAVLLEKGARAFQAPLSCIWLLDAGGTRHELAGCYGFTPKKAELIWERLALDGQEPRTRVLAGSALAAFTGFGKRRLGAVLALPLVTADGLLGWMVLARLEPAPFSEIEQEFIALVAGRVASSIENARLYQQTEARSRELELLYEISQLLVSTVRLDELLERLVQRMTETFSLTACGLRLYDPATDTVPFRALYHRDASTRARWWQQFQEDPVPMAMGRTGQIFRLKAPSIVQDASEDPLMRQVEREMIGVGSLVALPLFVRGEMIGVMFWFRAGRQNPLNESLIPLMTHLGNQVAIAIDNAQLVQHMEHEIAERTTARLAAHEALAGRVGANGPAYLARLASDLRDGLERLLSFVAILRHGTPDDAAQQARYADRLTAEAEGVAFLVEDLVGRLAGGDPPVSGVRGKGTIKRKPPDPSA